MLCYMPAIVPVLDRLCLFELLVITWSPQLLTIRIGSLTTFDDFLDRLSMLCVQRKYVVALLCRELVRFVERAAL